MTKLELVANHEPLADREAGINHAALDVCYDSLCEILTQSAAQVESNHEDRGCRANHEGDVIWRGGTVAGSSSRFL